uniref:Transcription elongation factor A protein 1 n=4 Tax=Sauria TaxID=32561 RepID=A0A8B9ZZH8_9AVES
MGPSSARGSGEDYNSQHAPSQSREVGAGCAGSCSPHAHSRKRGKRRGGRRGDYKSRRAPRAARPLHTAVPGLRWAAGLRRRLQPPPTSSPVPVPPPPPGPGRCGAMGGEEEIVKIARRLDKMVAKKSADGAMDLLKELKGMPMTLDLLQSTRIGMSVNALRKQSTDEEVIALAKSLIKSWKKLLDASEEKSEEKKKNLSLPTSSSKDTGNSKDQSSNKRQEPPKTPTTPKITTFPPAPVTCDAVRNKCREMLTTALQADDDYVAIGADCEHIAAQIEECIYQDIKNTDMKYKNRVRSRISNLKDSKNPELKKNVLCGAITPEQIAVMTSEEMASNELKEIRKAMTKEAIREHQMAKTGGTQTDLFTCGKCKKKNCTYTQVQTRSSDEPMTTFVVCNECGNRWKFC